jgi:hypothetical protein
MISMVRSHYVERVEWVDVKTVSISWLAREQQLRVRSLCSIKPRLTCSEVYRGDIKT